MIRKFNDDFRNLVLSNPNSPAFIINSVDNIITYSELNKLIDRCLLFIQDKKILPGSTILSIMPNKIETSIFFLAAIRGGYNFVPIPCTSSTNELQKILDLTKPDLCITVPVISEEIKISLGDNLIKTLYIPADSSFSWLDANLESIRPILGENPRIYIATSGTTGTPKIMIIDANILWSSGCAFVSFHNLQNAKLRFWNYLPMSYLGGLFNLTLIPLVMGGSIYIDEIFSGKTFLNFWQTVENFEITALWFVPSIVTGLIKLSETTKNTVYMKQKAQNIKMAFLGTAPIRSVKKRNFYDIFGLRLLENFALSETTFFTSEKASDAISTQDGDVGTVLPYTQIKFAKQDTQTTDNQSQEILIKSPFLFLGYLQSDGSYSYEKTADGFLKTGDIGFLNVDRKLIITGRIRDIIKKGGYLVSLREVEILVESMPEIKEAAAIKKSHPFYGETYVLFVLLHEDSQAITEHEISSFLHTNLVSHKWPEQVVIKKNFPKTNSGKIKKHLLVEFF